MQTETPIATLELLARLKLMHPELQWDTYPLGDYDQYAELDAPDVLVSFSDDDGNEGLADAFSTLMGKACEPSQWGISLEAAELIREHNKVFMAKYESSNGPRYKS